MRLFPPLSPLPPPGPKLENIPGHIDLYRLGGRKKVHHKLEISTIL
jgi:hypothetical protein